MQKRSIIFLIQIISFGLLLSDSRVCAETIILRSGQRVKGRIIEQTDYFIKVEVAGNPITYYFDQIDRIEQSDDPGLSKEQSSSTAKGLARADSARNSEYNAIFDTLKYFFEHRFNVQEALNSVSEDFQSQKRDGTKVNYDKFSKKLNKKKVVLLSVEDFQIIDLNIAGDSAETRVSFVQKTRRIDDGTIKDDTMDRKVFLQKAQGEWKIVNIEKRKQKDAGN